MLIDRPVKTFEELIAQAENILLEKNLAVSGDQILVMAGIPTEITKGTNFLKIHRVS